VVTAVAALGNFVTGGNYLGPWPLCIVGAGALELACSQRFDAAVSENPLPSLALIFVASGWAGTSGAT
jgi:hypothetical protein